MAVVLAATSNLLAQTITAYQKGVSICFSRSQPSSKRVN